MNTNTNKIINSKEFKKLSLIGGHKVYHLEGNAYKHSILVWRASKKIFRGDHLMQKTALLHDIGKIYTSVRAGKGDWTYPGHAKEGGNILYKFIDPSDKDYIKIKWYIENHIKPLYWKSLDEAIKLQKKAPEGCTIQNLAKLALCDLEGTKPAIGTNDEKLINFLWKVAEL